MEAKVLCRQNNSRQTRMLLALFPGSPHIQCKWKAGMAWEGGQDVTARKQSHDLPHSEALL